MCFRPPSIDLEDVKCSSCGEKIPTQAATCPNCGAQQAVFSEVAPPPIPGGGVKAPGAPRVPGKPGVPKALGAASINKKE